VGENQNRRAPEPSRALSMRSIGPLPTVIGACLAAGFAILALLWFTRGIWWTAPPTHVAGLFHYPSAYFGDSVLLPVAATMMAAGVKLLPRASHERVIAIVAGALAAASAIIAQVIWLADNHPLTNWTLPEPHRFNAAGVWHAIYFVGTATTLTILMALLSRRISAALHGPGRALVEALLRGAGPSLVLSCLLTYAVLATHDSLAPTLASRTSVAGIGITVAIFFGLAALVLRRSFGLIMAQLILAALAAATVVLSVDAPWSAERTHILGVAGAALAGVGVTLLSLVRGREMEPDDYRKYRPSPAQVPLVGVVLVVLLPALWTHAAAEVDASRWVQAGLWLAAYLAAIAVVPVLIVREQRAKWLFQASDVMMVFALLGVIVLIALTVPRWQEASDSAPFSSLLVAIAVSQGLFPIMRNRMNTEIRDEQGDANPSGAFGLGDVAKLSATATIGMLIISGLAGAVSLVGFTLATAVDRKYVADSGALPGIWSLLGVGVGLVLLTAVLALLKTRWLVRRCVSSRQ
jgi:hypothetical protein